MFRWIEMTCRFELSVLFLILINVTLNYALTYVTVGAVFDKSHDERARVLRHAVHMANQNVLRNSGIILDSNIERVSYGSTFAVSKSVCSLLNLRVGVIFGPEWSPAAAHAMNICDAKEIPYVETRFDEDAAQKRSVVNMHPSQDTLGQMLIDVIKAFEWKSFTILYQSPAWLQRIYRLLEMNNLKKDMIVVRQLVQEWGYLDFRPTLTKLKHSGERNIVLSCSLELLPRLLNHAMQVGLITDKYNFLINNMDIESINLKPYSYGGANITVFRILDSENSELKIFEDFLREEMAAAAAEAADNTQTDEDEDENKSDESSNQMDRISLFIAQDLKSESCIEEDFILKSKNLQNALIYDGVMAFAMALEQLGSEHVQTQAIDCREPGSAWTKGFTISNFMKNVKFVGLTNQVEFDNEGIRRNIAVDVAELKPGGLETVGKWVRSLETRGRFEPARRSNAISLNKTLVVVMALNDPYTMLKDSTIELTGNDRYEGYAVDLIDALAPILGINYEIIIEDDGNVGTYNNDTQTWDGMIGKIRAGIADLAISDLTMTSERILGIDFSPSIMNLGIAILYRKPQKEEPSTFSFMTPFSQDVWMYLAGAYMFVSMCFFFLGRISPSQWENPYPCVEEPKYLENQFTFQNSMWFAVGALLQQGSEIEPKAASIRMLSSVWWFFTLIIVSSYTANLAASLTVEEPHIVIKSVDTLRECAKSTEGCPFHFGAKKGGSTLNYFKNHEPEMYEYMIRHEHMLTNDNKEGLDKVLDKSENYAFLMESSTILYHTERICNLTQIGEQIDDKNYAIGMRKNYEHYGELSKAVLLLQEQGLLDQIQTRWWKQKKGGGACTKKEESRPEELGLVNMKGVFIVLSSGCILAFIYGCIEKTAVIFKEAKQRGASFRAGLRSELRFLLKSYKNIKPIIRSVSSPRSDQSLRSDHS